MRSMRSTISIGVTTYGTVPSSQAQAWFCADAGNTKATKAKSAALKEWISWTDLGVQMVPDYSTYNVADAALAQWIERPTPKGQVARSIRVRGASSTHGGVNGGRTGTNGAGLQHYFTPREPLCALTLRPLWKRRRVRLHEGQHDNHSPRPRIARRRLHYRRDEADGNGDAAQRPGPCHRPEGSAVRLQERGAHHARDAVQPPLRRARHAGRLRREDRPRRRGAARPERPAHRHERLERRAGEEVAQVLHQPRALPHCVHSRFRHGPLERWGALRGAISAGEHFRMRDALQRIGHEHESRFVEREA